MYNIAESCQRLAVIVQTMTLTVANDENTENLGDLLNSLWTLYEYVLFYAYNVQA